MDQGSENKTRYCQILLSTVLLVGTTAVFAFIGATGVLKIASTIILLCATQQINSPSFLFLLPPPGPKSSQGTYHAMYTCVVPSASDHVWNPATPMVDEESCSAVGRKLIREEEQQKHLPHYPLQNIVFYTQIPFLKNMVMSREFEFLLADLGLHFVFSQYLKEAVGECRAPWAPA